MKIKGGFATALDRTENKMMEKDEDLKYALKLASFFHIMLRTNVLNFQQWGNILEFLAAAWNISQFQFFFFFRNYRGKARNMQFLIFLSLWYKSEITTKVWQ